MSRTCTAHATNSAKQNLTELLRKLGSDIIPPANDSGWQSRLGSQPHKMSIAGIGSSGTPHPWIRGEHCSALRGQAVIGEHSSVGWGLQGQDFQRWDLQGRTMHIGVSGRTMHIEINWVGLSYSIPTRISADDKICRVLRTTTRSLLALLLQEVAVQVLELHSCMLCCSTGQVQ